MTAGSPSEVWATYTSSTSGAPARNGPSRSAPGSRRWSAGRPPARRLLRHLRQCEQCLIGTVRVQQRERLIGDQLVTVRFIHDAIAYLTIDRQRVSRSLQTPHQIPNSQRDQLHGRARLIAEDRLREQPLDLIEFTELVQRLRPESHLLGGHHCPIREPRQLLHQAVVVRLSSDARRCQQQLWVGGTAASTRATAICSRSLQRRAPWASIRSAPSRRSRRVVNAARPPRITSPYSGWTRRTC